MIRWRLGVAGACLATSLAMLARGVAVAAPRRASRAPSKTAPVAPPPPPLAMLPSIARVRIEPLESRVVVVEEVNLPRGEWKGESLDFYVAFGAPGVPRAFDAHLVPVRDGALEPEDGEAGESLVVEHAARRPVSAHALLGKDTMAGLVVHVSSEALARALRPGNMAALRLRTALDLPDEDSRGARGLVIRLGASRGTPLTLGRIVLRARAGVPTRAEARLCGPDADATPLAVTLTPRPKAPTTPAAATIAPVLAVRHATDDLCVRFWLPP